MAQFPKFITTGPTIDIPVAPMQYQGMNLLPAIELLRQEQRKAPTTGTPKGRDSDFKIEGTIGQVAQWQRNVDKIYNKMEALIGYYGPDIALTMPEYRKLANEASYYESREMQNTAKVNKERIDAYDKTVAEKNASGIIHLGMLGRTGQAMSNTDWSRLQQYAETGMLGDVSKNADEWLQNFEWNPYIVREEDALEEMNSIFDNVGYSESGWKQGSETIEERIKGNIYGMLQQYDSSFSENMSNYNAYGEGPKGQGQGQLEQAKAEAWKRAMSVFNTEDKLAAGLFQGFIQNTTSTRPGDKTSAGVKEGFLRRYNPNRSEEEEKNLASTHDGYYFKKGHEREGELDSDLMVKDAMDYAEYVTERHFEKRKKNMSKGGQDMKLTFTAAPDEAYKGIGAAKKIETMLGAAREYNISLGTNENQGFTADDLAGIAGIKIDDGGVTDFMANLTRPWENPDVPLMLQEPKAGYIPISPEEAGNVVNTAVSGNFSPFEAKYNSAGEITYTPSDDYNPTDFYDNLYSKYVHMGDSPEVAKRKAEDMTRKATQLHGNAKRTISAQGGFGLTRTDGVAIHFPADAVDTDIFKSLDEMIYTGISKDKDGKAVFKKGSDVLFNHDIHFGETVAEGATILGDNVSITGYSGDLSMKAVSLASNAGAAVMAPVTIGGRKYGAGEFIHMSVFDGLSPGEIKQLQQSGAINIGTGYWNKTDKGWVDGARPNMVGALPMGKNSEAIMGSIVNDDPNAPYAEPNQYYTTMDFTINNWNKQVSEWESKGITFVSEVPQYVDYDKTGKAKENFEQAKSKLNSAYTGYQAKFGGGKTMTIDAAAEAIGIKKGSSQHASFVRDMKGVGAVDSKGNFIYGNKAIGVAGKYQAELNGEDVRLWNITPTLTKKSAVTNGIVDPEFEQQLGIIKDRKTNTARGSVNANVTGAVLKAAGGHKFHQGATQIYNTSKAKKSSGTTGAGADNQQGANRNVLAPGIIPKK